jgi:hypothetical protein
MATTTTHQSGRRTEVLTATTILPTDLDGQTITSLLECVRYWDGEYDCTTHFGITDAQEYILLGGKRYADLLK